MSRKYLHTLALFYCQNVPESGESERQALEKEYGRNIRLFPIPCSGRLEPFHLLRALEEFADAAYLITCPEGACRYFEGNKRAKKPEFSHLLGERVGELFLIIQFLSNRCDLSLSEVSHHLS